MDAARMYAPAAVGELLWPRFAAGIGRRPAGRLPAGFRERAMAAFSSLPARRGSPPLERTTRDGTGTQDECTSFRRCGALSIRRAVSRLVVAILLGGFLSSSAGEPVRAVEAAPAFVAARASARILLGSRSDARLRLPVLRHGNRSWRVAVPMRRPPRVLHGGVWPLRSRAVGACSVAARPHQRPLVRQDDLLRGATGSCGVHAPRDGIPVDRCLTS